MLEELIDRFAGEVVGGTMRQASSMIRTEANYVASTIRLSIHEGIRGGFESVRRHIFHLFLAMGASMVGLIFVTWGLAKAFDDYFKALGPEGTGFIIFGMLLLIIGLLNFALSKPKE